MRKLIVIPTYNERKNIEELLGNIFNFVPDVNVLIVDDNSPDGTGSLVNDLIDKKVFDNRLFVLHRAGKLGLAIAYIEGFTWGIENGYDVFLSMDADFSHNPKYLPEIFSAMKEYDLVIGSRYIKGGGLKDWPFLRRLISRGGNLYAQIMLMTKTRDLTGGFNCYHKKFLEKININSIVSNGYCFQIEMKFRHILSGCKIKEIPIVFTDRIMGVSKMSGSIFKEAVLNVVKLSLIRYLVHVIRHLYLQYY